MQETAPIVDWYFSEVDGKFLTMFRVVVFGLPLYVLLSRYYGCLNDIPQDFVEAKYVGKRYSTLTFLSPETVPFRAVYVVAIVACATGVHGIFPSVSAVVASLSIVALNNYYAVVTTSDVEILPFIFGMWTFAVLPTGLSVPLWVELSGTIPPTAPAFPFRVVQVYLCMLMFLNGVTKLPFWREWVNEKGLFYDARNWNLLSPYLDTYWYAVEDTRDVPYLWETLGVLTIVIELGAATAVLYPPLAVLWLPGVIGLFVGNHLLRSTSFLLIPWIYAASFLPWLGEVIL